MKLRKTILDMIHEVSLESLRTLWWCVFILSLMVPTSFSLAVQTNPDRNQIEQAVRQGIDFAQQHRPPNELYWHFGSHDHFEPHGFLVTKLSGLAVMASHYGLRGEQPTEQDIQRIVSEKDMQVVVTVFGDSPDFAWESYLLMKQNTKVVKPERIRFDAQARMVAQDQRGGVYEAKIVGLFPYSWFDPMSHTILAVFPGSGGEITFEVDFSAIP